MNYREIPIGKIPEDWEIVRLGEVVEIHDNKRIPLNEQERAKMKGPYPYCGANGIMDYINDYIFDGEYILLAEDGGYWGKFEKSAYIMRGKFWVNNHAHVLKALGGVADNWFLMYVLNFLDLTPYIVGSTRGKLNQKEMKNILIPLPPLEEQKKIAEILSTVDKAIEKVDEAIARTERLKKSLMQELLTRGIGHKEFKFSKELSCRIPKVWKVVKLKDIAEKTRNSFVDGPFGSDLKKEEFVDYGIPVIQLHNVREDIFVANELKYITEEKFNKLIRHETRPGDVIITKLGDPIAQACVVPDMFEKYMIVADCVRLRVDKKIADPYFVQYVINSRIIRRQALAKAKGTTRKRINLSEIRELLIPLPPLLEQQKIAEILSTIDKKLELERKRKEKLEKIKRGLMNDLLTGKVRVKI